jgi:hypothetical protein
MLARNVVRKLDRRALTLLAAALVAESRWSDRVAAQGLAASSRTRALGEGVHSPTSKQLAHCATTILPLAALFPVPDRGPRVSQVV